MPLFTNIFDAADAITAAGFTHMRYEGSGEIDEQDAVISVPEYLDSLRAPPDPQRPQGLTRDEREDSLGGNSSRALYELRETELLYDGDIIYTLLRPEDML